MRNWSGAATSSLLALTGGQRYYIEVLHKEGGGGDNAAVTWNWRSPGTWATPTNGSTPLPGAILEYQVGGTLDDNASPPADYPPLAVDQAIVIYGGATTAITLGGEDFEDSPLGFAIVDGPAKGVLGGTIPDLTYTPNGGASGTDVFTFKVNDGGLDSAIATVTLSLIPEAGSKIVQQGTVQLNKGSWYNGYAGGSGTITVQAGGTAINRLAHAFGSGTGPNRDIVLLGGRFRMQRESAESWPITPFPVCDAGIVPDCVLGLVINNNDGSVLGEIGINILKIRVCLKAILE